MPRYQYSAVNKQGKNLSGVISASDSEKGKSKLKALKLTVIAIEQLPETNEVTENKSKYKFEAKNKEAKKVVGTIEAQDLFSAFNRLISEYELTVVKLAGITSTELEFETSQTKVQELYGKKAQTEEVKANDNSKEEYLKQKEKQQFTHTIEEIVLIIRSILTEFEGDLKPESEKFLKDYAEHLEKIKFSDNTESIIASANKVLKHLQTQQMYLNEQANGEEKLNKKLDFMQKFGLLKKLGKGTGQEGGFSKALSVLGVDSSSSTSGLSKAFEQIKNQFSLIFTAKSNSDRKLALKKFFQSFTNLFKRNPNKLGTGMTQNITPKKKDSIGKFEAEIHSITFWLMGVYLAYYFLSTFLSQKILEGNLHPIFYTHNTSFLIYFIIGILFIHSAIHLRILLHKHKIMHSTVVYPLFSLLYLLILINL